MNLRYESDVATAHAATRSQKRGIPPLILEWLMAYGEEQPDHHGARVVYFTKESRRRIGQVNGDMIVRRLRELLDTYAVISGDGRMITCGHRFKKINKN